MLRATPLVAALGFGALLLPPIPSADPPLPVIAHNDNRQPAGRAGGATLGVDLEVRMGAWHLLGREKAAGEVLAFGEIGGTPSIPGPLLRVPHGTTMRVRVTNRHAKPIVVHGLSSRRLAVLDTLLVPAGGSAEARFAADVEGTYYYWAAEAGTGFGDRLFHDSQLYGVFVVDPAGAAPAPDRIFVIGEWVNGKNSDGTPDFNNAFLVVNGRPWPHTERLAYQQGDSVRWRLLNPTPNVHPMHLHGFYYRVDARGDLQRDTLYWQAQRRMVVTELMLPGTTMSMAFSPDRPGGWVFHCHLNWHVISNPGMGPDKLPTEKREAEVVKGHPDHEPHNHVEAQMGGLMLAMYVRPTAGAAAPVAPRRTLRLLVQENGAEADDKVRYGFVRGDGRDPRPDSVQVPGATLVLHRGEPTRIWVVNRTRQPTQVHWHGLEIESAFDGVVGVGGMKEGPTPAIMPGDSFEVRVTPPRAGSFMYHTHLNEIRQMTRGLWGPLLVLEPGASHDPDRDRVFMAGEDADFQVNLNGSRQHAPITLTSDTDYRFRLMNVAMDGPGLHYWLTTDGAPIQWTPVAKDGHDLPAWQSTPKMARQAVSIGETMDVRVNLPRAGDYALELRTFSGRLIARQPIKAQGKPPTVEQQIAAAVLPMPEGMRARATVLGYREPGKLEEVRKGSNGMVCLADDPGLPAFHVACYHESMEPFMARGRALRAEGVSAEQVDTVRFREAKEGKLKLPTDPAALWTLSAPANSWDPATNEVKGGRSLYVVYIPYATEASTGLPATPARGTPWLMFPGTPKAHIMFVPTM